MPFGQGARKEYTEAGYRYVHILCTLCQSQPSIVDCRNHGACGGAQSCAGFSLAWHAHAIKRSAPPPSAAQRWQQGAVWVRCSLLLRFYSHLLPAAQVQCRSGTHGHIHRRSAFSLCCAGQRVMPLAISLPGAAHITHGSWRMLRCICRTPCLLGWSDLQQLLVETLPDSVTVHTGMEFDRCVSSKVAAPAPLAHAGPHAKCRVLAQVQAAVHLCIGCTGAVTWSTGPRNSLASLAVLVLLRGPGQAWTPAKQPKQAHTVSPTAHVSHLA
jgi:hypothetical protein